MIVLSTVLMLLGCQSKPFNWDWTLDPDNTSLKKEGYHELVQKYWKRESKSTIKSWKRKCSEATDVGHADSCFRLGWLYEEGEYVEQSFEKAEKFYTLSCGNQRGKFKRSCVRLGGLYEKGKYVEQSFEQAEKYYTLALGKGKWDVGLAYDKLGDLYRNIKFNKYNEAKAMEFAQKACDDESGYCAKNRLLFLAYLKDNGKRLGVKTTESGMQYEIIKRGTGSQPNLSDIVGFHIRGSFIDGTEFLSTFSGEPAGLQINKIRLDGLIEGLQMMNLGAKYRFWLPPSKNRDDAIHLEFESLPYNPVGLIFDVELLKVADALSWVVHDTKDGASLKIEGGYDAFLYGNYSKKLLGFSQLLQQSAEIAFHRTPGDWGELGGWTYTINFHYPIEGGDFIYYRQGLRHLNLEIIGGDEGDAIDQSDFHFLKYGKWSRAKVLDSSQCSAPSGYKCFTSTMVISPASKVLLQLKNAEANGGSLRFNFKPTWLKHDRYVDFTLNGFSDALAKAKTAEKEHLLSIKEKGPLLLYMSKINAFDMPNKKLGCQVNSSPPYSYTPDSLDQWIKDLCLEQQSCIQKSVQTNLDAIGKLVMSIDGSWFAGESDDLGNKVVNPITNEVFTWSVPKTCANCRDSVALFIKSAQKIAGESAAAKSKFESSYAIIRKKEVQRYYNEQEYRAANARRAAKVKADQEQATYRERQADKAASSAFWNRLGNINRSSKSRGSMGGSGNESRRGSGSLPILSTTTNPNGKTIIPAGGEEVHGIWDPEKERKRREWETEMMERRGSCPSCPKTGISK